MDEYETLRQAQLSRLIANLSAIDPTIVPRVVELTEDWSGDPPAMVLMGTIGQLLVAGGDTTARDAARFIEEALGPDSAIRDLVAVGLVEAYSNRAIECGHEELSLGPRADSYLAELDKFFGRNLQS